MSVRDELKSIAEILPEAGKHNAYRVPEGYFDHLVSKVEDRLGIDTDIDYSIPDNYFDSLPEKILRRVDSALRKEKMTIPMWIRHAGIAASFLIIVFTGSILLRQPAPATSETSVEMQYLEYLTSFAEDVDASLLLDLNILDEGFVIQDIDELDDSLLDYYLERHLDDIELAYLEDFFE